MNIEKLLTILIHDFIKNIDKEKLAFNIINGGWEKFFENELGYLLFKEKLKNNEWVKMQDKKKDITIYNKNFNIENTIEIGHYTFNQSPEKEFKPITDILKREKQGCKNVFHIQLIEYVHLDTNEEYKKFKYGNTQRKNIEYYENLYIQSQLNYNIFPKLHLKHFGYEIDSYIIFSYR